MTGALPENPPPARVVALLELAAAHEAAAARYDGLTPLETLLTADQIAELDRSLKPEAAT